MNGKIASGTRFWWEGLATAMLYVMSSPSWFLSRNKWEGKDVDVIFDVISSTLQFRMCDSSRQIRHTG